LVAGAMTPQIKARISAPRKDLLEEAVEVCIVVLRSDWFLGSEIHNK
jgi:hypothetical protein